MAWIKVCEEDMFRTTYCFRHRRKEIAIYKLKDGIYATDNSCSHEYSPLCEGIVMDGNVYCPKHGSRFDIKTGAVLDPPAIRPVKVYKVKVENGAVFVKL